MDMRIVDVPRVAILLTTFNGASWLRQQVESIRSQRGVCVHIFASDDRSRDGTMQILHEEADSTLTVLAENAERFGNANRNFLRLICEVEVAGFDYVSFADQDDIWLEDKLATAIKRMRELNAQAYSSDVLAFWEGGREQMVIKSQPQRQFDYLFESAGPGCTFVIARDAYLQLQTFVRLRLASAREAKVHDWLIYAYARANGWRWHIDRASHMRYRQHASNEAGVNTGLKAIRKRWTSVRSGDFRTDVLTIARLVEDESWVREALERFGVADRIRLALSARHFRRRRVEQLLLAVFFLLMRRKSVAPHNA